MVNTIELAKSVVRVLGHPAPDDLLEVWTVDDEEMEQDENT